MIHIYTYIYIYLFIHIYIYTYIYIHIYIYINIYIYIDTYIYIYIHGEDLLLFFSFLHSHVHTRAFLWEKKLAELHGLARSPLKIYSPADLTYWDHGWRKPLSTMVLGKVPSAMVFFWPFSTCVCFSLTLTSSLDGFHCLLWLSVARVHGLAQAPGSLRKVGLQCPPPHRLPSLLSLLLLSVCLSICWGGRLCSSANIGTKYLQ